MASELFSFDVAGIKVAFVDNFLVLYPSEPTFGWFVLTVSTPPPPPRYYFLNRKCLLYIYIGRIVIG